MTPAEVEAYKCRPTNTVKATAQFIGVGLKEAYAAIHRNELPSLRLGRTILVPTAKILALLEEA
jgi:excisionase family DNA binding protein